MLLDAAAEEAAAAAEEIPGTVVGKGKEKADDTSEEEDFNFQDILGIELLKAEKEELKEYAISCG
jgi:ribosomal 30S subunit maturation factor RimM